MRTEFLVLPLSLLLLVLPANALAQQCETPNMMILLDRSGSMHWSGCTNNTKWADATNAINFIVSNYGGTLRFGLDMFPSDDGCSVGVVYVDTGLNTYSSIMNWLANFPPYGGCIGMTPLAVSLAALNQYRPLKDPNRRNFIMLISDGDDTCAGSPSSDPVRAASDLLAGGVRTFVIGFGSGANPTVLNNVASAGGTGSYYQADNQASLQQAMNSIVNAALVELCDNRDNDCDQLTDEDWPTKGQICTAQVGNCTGTGVWICNAAGNGLVCNAQVSTSPEVCDGLDNDCDGLVDEDFPDADGDGYKTCTDCNDSNPAVHPGATERCNAIDDDCDGATDESDPQMNAACGATDVGECEFGALLCVSGSMLCVGEIGPVAEIFCDGLDNDCDGQNDDSGPEICDDGVDNDCDGLIDGWDDDCGAAGCVPGQQRPCGSDTGDCVAGVETCAADGTWGPCEGGYSGGVEVCDGRDNDCDGLVDEDDVCGSGTDCEPGQTEACGIDEGECRTGIRTCAADGRWAPCAGAIDPLPEWCDRRDNDCDGLTDEGDLCEGYEECLCGVCAPPCAAGECPSGAFTCLNNWCVQDACCGIHCPGGFECDESGRCIDRCVTEGIQCLPDQDCRMGICVTADCYTAGHDCEPGLRCAQGVCVADPCYNFECPDGQYCRAGVCQDLACSDCSPGQLCQAGICQDSLCASVSCPPGQVCLAGNCVADPCQGVYCLVGEVCSLGDCVADPCALVDCPDGSHCQAGYCLPAEPVGPDGGTDAGPDGNDAGPDGSNSGLDAGPDAGTDTSVSPDGGPGADQDNGSDGCGCATRAGRVPIGGFWLLALAGMLLKRLRRRAPSG